jgi:hypothetical protein
MLVSLSFSFGPSRLAPLLRPLLTSRAAAFATSPFQAQGEISPGKNVFLPRTTAGSTFLSFDHQGFVATGPLASLGAASYPVFVHRPAVSLPASSPRSVALSQLQFASIRMVSFRGDFHPQDDIHAGRTRSAARPPHELFVDVTPISRRRHRPLQRLVRRRTRKSTLTAHQLEERETFHGRWV